MCSNHIFATNEVSVRANRIDKYKINQKIQIWLIFLHKNNKSFEDIKHSDENGIEFWYARELMPVLQYSNWQNFEKIINKAKISCENSDISVLDHFIDVSRMVQ